mmetsp:Transcript_13826/g.28211  ORF Transcript_13826/g.28211 Transcript_13826/m.28211 type:complete len:83 (-) Transcript_13826:82-330(-)
MFVQRNGAGVIGLEGSQFPGVAMDLWAHSGFDDSCNFLPEFSALAEQTEQSRGANFVSVDNIHVKANKIACVNRKNIFPSAP